MGSQPFDNPDDLLGEAIKRLSPAQSESMVGKAADEAVRLGTKEQEGQLDVEMASAQVSSVAAAAQRLRGTGAEFEIAGEQRSQHGSVRVTVRSRRMPITSRLAGRFPLPPKLLVLVVLTCTVFVVPGGVWVATQWLGNRQPAAGPEHGTLSPQLTALARIIDGDTLVVKGLGGESGEERVRLLGIDTPERGDRLHAAAGAALAEILGDAGIRLEFETPGVVRRDRYGRVLAYILADGTNANIEMVRQGWSQYITAYGRSRFDGAFQTAEAEARAAHRGIWSSE